MKLNLNSISYKIKNSTLGDLKLYYKILGYNLHLSIFLSLIVAILDGIGLSIFIPLLSSANNSDSDLINNTESNGESLLQKLFQELTLGEMLLTMLIFFSLKGAVKYFSEYIRVILQQNYIVEKRKKLIDLIVSTKYSYFVKTDTGKVLNILTLEIERLQQSFQHFLISIESACMIFMYFVFALIIDIQFTIFVCFGGIITNFIFKTIYKKTKKNSSKLSDEGNVYQGGILEIISNFKYLKSTNTLNKLLPKTYNSIYLLKDLKTTLGKLTGFIVSIREPILIFVVVGVILIQYYLLSGDLNSILISLLFFYRALASLGKMQNSWNVYLSNSGSVKNINTLEEQLREQQIEQSGSKNINQITNIQLEKVSFNYDNSPTLKEINLTIDNFESIGIVGESGSGKTTLINLISGLLTPTFGKIFINNEPLDKINISSYQNRIGVVTQDPAIFNTTIFNNVTLWAEKTNINLKKFNDIINKVKLTDFLNELPLKENSILERGGLNLSGGQKQRISIARELFKDSDLLIFDEATSALDAETENWIKESIDDLRGECIIITIAHRISTIQNMDQIILMEKGRIIDIGNFKELINRNDYFKELTTTINKG